MKKIPRTGEQRVNWRWWRDRSCLGRGGSVAVSAMNAADPGGTMAFRSTLAALGRPGAGGAGGPRGLSAADAAL